MPEMSILRSHLEQAGYRIEEMHAGPSLFACRLSGGELGSLQPVLRAEGDQCQVYVGIGTLGAVPSQHRYDVAVDLLGLNFDSLATIALFRVPPNADKEKNIAILLASSSFYWTEFTAPKFSGRMRALAQVAFAASQLLNARGALIPTNPFYQRLKSPTT